MPADKCPQKELLVVAVGEPVPTADQIPDSVRLGGQFVGNRCKKATPLRAYAPHGSLLVIAPTRCLVRLVPFIELF